MTDSSSSRQIPTSSLMFGLAMGWGTLSLLAGNASAASIATDEPSLKNQKAPEAIDASSKATLATSGKKGPHSARQEDGSEAEEWVVTASPMNTLRTPMGISRMPHDALHTPQTINVVPQILMQQQNVKSLDEALKNVPGITASVGKVKGAWREISF